MRSTKHFKLNLIVYNCGAVILMKSTQRRYQIKHRQKFRTRDTTRGYARQPEDRSGRRSVQRFVWAFEKNGKYLFKTQRK